MSDQTKSDRVIRRQAAELEKHLTENKKLQSENRRLERRISRLTDNMEDYKKKAADATRVRRKLLKQKKESKYWKRRAQYRCRRYLWWRSRSIKWERHARRRGFIGDVDEGAPGTPEPQQEPVSPVSSISPPRSLFNGCNRSDSSDDSPCRYCSSPCPCCDRGYSM